jgi:hypothetical protein
MRRHSRRSPSKQLGVQLIPVLVDDAEGNVEVRLATLAIATALACKKAAEANFGTYDELTNRFIEDFKTSTVLLEKS